MAFTGDFSRITETSAEFSATFTGGDASFASYRYVELVIDNRFLEIRSNERGGSRSTFDKTVTRLKPGTTYDWAAQLGYDNNGSITWLDVYDEGIFTTDKEIILIDPWSWTSSNGEATRAQTQTAYDVLHGNAPANQFSHYVWNDLVAKTLEMREAKGYTWDTAGGNYLTASRCRMSAGDTLSAEAYNSVKYNIGSVLATDIFDQSRGDPITGYKIYHLTEVLNEIIDRL